MPEIRRACTVSDDQARRVDRIVQQLTDKSRAEVRGLFDAGGVTLDGRPCENPGAPVLAGSTVEVRFDPARRYRQRPPVRSPRGFQLVYEDADLLVVEKEAALLTVPTHKHERRTLVDLVSQHVNRANRGPRAGVVHRLDRGTSGLLVFGKRPQITAELHAQFRARKTDREYLAIVAGVPTPAAGAFSSRLATNKALSRFSTSNPAAGEHAVTHYRTERVVPEAALLRVWLETGRRNQIRVHFAEAGHPVLGDRRYRPDRATHPHWKSPRMALHAATLGFHHPRTGEPLRFESPLPPEFERFLRRR